MRAAILTAVVLLTGCGTTRLSDDPDASYFLISQGGTNLLSSVLGGSVKFCKVTQSNLGESDYVVDVKYDGDECIVEAAAAR